MISTNHSLPALYNCKDKTDANYRLYACDVRVNNIINSLTYCAQSRDI